MNAIRSFSTPARAACMHLRFCDTDMAGAQGRTNRTNFLATPFQHLKLLTFGHHISFTTCSGTIAIPGKGEGVGREEETK
jgi:hypothetical protein